MPLHISDLPAELLARIIADLPTTEDIARADCVELFAGWFEGIHGLFETRVAQSRHEIESTLGRVCEEGEEEVWRDRLRA